MPETPNVILSGIVGSTAYGLAGPDSDVDRLGFFAAPTANFHGLAAPPESKVTTKPDVTLHELGKACRLLLATNPTVTELLWLPSDLYETRTPIGEELIALRTSFLAARKVRNAYLGYATQQFKRLTDRGDGSFSADTRKRTAKHARHLKRLLNQGCQLHSTGTLSVRLTDPARCQQFGEQVASGDTSAAVTALAAAEQFFDKVPSVLPATCDSEPIDAWLKGVRARLFTTEEASRG